MVQVRSCHFPPIADGMPQPDPWQPYYGKSMVEVVDARWRAEVISRIRDHGGLNRWRKVRERFGSWVVTPPDDQNLMMLLGPSWWAEIDAAAITIAPAAYELDPLNHYLASHNPKTLPLLPRISDEIQRLRPFLMTHAIMPLIEALSRGTVRISAILDSVDALYGTRIELPVEAIRGRFWSLRRHDGSVAIRYFEGSKVQRFGLARLEPDGTDMVATRCHPAVHQDAPGGKRGRRITSQRSGTGAPGRPTKSMHLIIDECRRRLEAGIAEPRLADEARALLVWLWQEQPIRDRPTEKSIANAIRGEYRAYRIK